MHRSAKTNYQLKKRASNNWYLYWRENGRPRYKSLGTRSKVQAEKIKKKLLAGMNSVDQVPASIWEGADAWVADKERAIHGLTQSTLATYRLIAKRVKEFWPADMLLEDITTPSVDSFLDFLERKYKNSPSGLKKKLGILRSFFKWHHERGNMPRNPAAPINLRGVKSERHPAMEEEEYHKLLADVKKWVDSPVRAGFEAQEVRIRNERNSVYDLIELLWYSGLRSIEAIRMEWDDIDLDRRIWTIQSPKNKGGDRVLPFHSMVGEVLRRRLDSNPTRPFPPLLRNQWKAFKTANPQWMGTNLHSIRHSFVTRVVLNGHPWAAQMLASHHSTEMTQLYTHAQADDLREGLDSL